MKNMEVSVVVTCYNEEENIRECLNTLISGLSTVNALYDKKKIILSGNSLSKGGRDENLFFRTHSD